jgi:hypothetical protein
MLKVFANPVGLHSRAMVRVVNGLASHAPSHVRFVTDPAEADLRVIHAISHEFAQQIVPGQAYVWIQYCLRTTSDQKIDEHFWLPIWDNAALVWSYFDLPEILRESEASRTNGFAFYHSPLGLSTAFVDSRPNVFLPVKRDIGVMSSGFVSGPSAEAIEEVAMAADTVGISVLHLGPEAVVGMRVKPPRWKNVLGVSDVDLAHYYERCEWVSALRHVEGFEMPAIEALACGARPIVFDRPDMTQWYEGLATFVPEAHGYELVDSLTEILRHHPKPVTDAQREEVRRRFDWKTVATGFWDRVLSEQQ